mgnify:FL=1
MAFSGRGAKRRGHCLAGRDGDGRAPVHGLFPRWSYDSCDRRGHSSRISQREGAPICTGTRTGHPWHSDQPVGLRHSNVVLPQLEAGQKTCSVIIFFHSGISRILWLRFNSYKTKGNHMKKYITSGIAALITLAAICMMTGQSEASSPRQSVEDAICHQQNPGVKVCPACKGTGEVGKCIKCSRCGGKGIVRG